MTNKLNQNDQIRALFNDLLYVLTNSYYSGKDSNRVSMAKEFVKEMSNDFETRVKHIAEEAETAELEAKAKVEEANKPVSTPVRTSESK